MKWLLGTNGSYELDQFSRNKEIGQTSVYVVPRSFVSQFSQNPWKHATYNGGWI